MAREDLGKISITPKGTFTTQTTGIEKNDIWKYGNSKFLALIDNPVVAPVDDGINWYELSTAGESAYDEAVKQGFTGTRVDWIQSLKQPAEDAASNAVIAIAAIDKTIDDEIAKLANTIQVATVSQKTSSLFDQSQINDNVLTIVNKRILYGGKKVLTRKVASEFYFVFWMISDPHGDSIGIQKSVDFCNKQGDCVMLLGDVLWKQPMEAAVFSSIKPYLCIVGNHDAVDLQETNAIATNYFITRFQSINNVVETGMPYFYKDFPGKLIRVIGLYEYDYETCGTPLNSRYGVVYSQTQIDWLIATLASTPKDYFIILLHHQPAGVTRPQHSDRFISSNAPLFYEFESNIEDTANITPEIIEAFRTGVNLTAKIFNNGTSGGTVTVTTNFTGPSDKFVGHFAGHTHWDVVEYLPKYPAQLQVVIDQSRSNEDDSHYVYSDLAKRVGSGMDYVINRVTIDIIEKTLTIDRFGAKYTDDGRTRDFITYPFTPDVGDIRLVITPNVANLYINTTLQLVCTINTYPTSAVIYSSSDETVATVDSNGLVTTTEKVGTAIITAYNSTYNISGVCALKTKVHTLSVNSEAVNVFLNGTYRILVSIDGTLITSGVTFTSSDETIATVAPDGTVTTTGKSGNVDVLVSYAEYSLTKTVVITNQTNSLSVDSNSINLYPNQTHQIIAYFNGVQKTSGITYLSSDATIASVDSSGLVTCIKNGSVNITVTDTDHTLSVDIALVVSSVLALNKASETINQLATLQLLAYLNGVQITTGLTFASSDSNIAFVDSSGVITSGINNGIATITVTEASSGLQKTMIVTNSNVLTLDNTTLAIENASTAIIRAYLNGVLTTAVGFTSSDTTIANVASDGTITTTTKVGAFNVTVHHNVYNIEDVVNCTNKAVSPLASFRTRVTADGGIFLYSDLDAQYAADTALLGGVAPKLAYYAYKLDGSNNIVKLYSVDSSYDCTGLSTSNPNTTDSPTSGAANLTISNGKITLKDSSNPGFIIMGGRLNNKDISKLYYAGNLTAATTKAGVFMANINPYFDSLNAGNSTCVFYKSGLIHIERGLASSATQISMVKAYPVSGTFNTLFIDFLKSDSYINECKINGELIAAGTPVDYWTYQNFSFIMINNAFDRILAG